MADPRVARVLISVTDKTGVVGFARALSEEFGAEIVSTGGTAKTLAEAGIAVRAIDDLTGFPEMMDGRVKTLHPCVHGGLLARRDLPSHMKDAADHGIAMIDMVVVNLYAFEATVASPDVTYADAIEHIDIGGPSMLRSAAKNHASVTVVTSPALYEGILDEMRAHDGATTLATRQRCALEVFRVTSAYDNAISTWLDQQLEPDTVAFAASKRVFLKKKQELRYGENPHQQAAFYVTDDASATAAGIEPAFTLAHAEQLQGKELSYNNYLDIDAAWSAVREFSETACVIVKHLTPCGIALGSDASGAYRSAHACDPISAYGGVMAFNTAVTAGVVEAIYENKQFIEAIIAPAFDAEALELLTQKPNARVLVTGGMNPVGTAQEFRSVEGGMLVETYDKVAEDPAAFTVPTRRQPTSDEMAELLFAWKAIRPIKSNAILITKDRATVGVGAGQPNRVNSARIAVEQAGTKAQGAVAASDAFMPFPDSLEALVEAGVTAVIQPGGSIRDQLVIDAADAAGVALVFTGHRHFRH
jgi:phosphoribosylaminoimidazolecarboxamide formyltransferase / IMP cyclohydrolase